MLLRPAMVGLHASIVRLEAANSAWRSRAKSIGGPSLPEDAGYLSVSSQSSTRIGRMAKFVGLFAPTMVTCPPGNCLWVIVLPASRACEVKIGRSTFVSRIIGASRSFEKVSAALSFGCTTRIGQGSRWMK